MHAGTPAEKNGAENLSPPYLQFVDEHGDGIELVARAGRVGHRERGICVGGAGPQQAIEVFGVEDIGGYGAALPWAEG